MKWSFRFARVFGIDLKVHVSFVLALFVGASWFAGSHGVVGALFGATLALVLFACVLLHELGHSLAAKAFGVPTSEIILLPIGGVALLSRMPRQPFQELVIAIAGPLVNVVLAGVLFVMTGASAALSGHTMNSLAATIGAPSLTTFLYWLFGANVSLVLFNLVPAFPLDGGRMLRATLAFFTDYARATRIAAGIGQFIALALGLYGIASGNLTLALIALFIFLGAGSESYHTSTATILARLTARDACNRHAIQLHCSDTVERAAELVLTSYQPDFAVLDGDDFVGVVTRDDLVRALAEGKSGASVVWIMRRDVLRLPADATLDRVREQLVQHTTRIAAVEDAGGHVLGLISLEDIAEAMLLIPHLRQGEAASREPSIPPGPAPRPDAQRWI